MQSKLPHIGTSIFTVMSQLAAKHNAINLGQGFPDFPMSAELIECVNKAMQSGGNQYAHTNGVPLLRERLAEKIKYLYDVNINPETNITITPGGTYSIFCAFSTIIQPGDEVIIFEPAYDSYIPNIVFNGGIVVPIELEFPDYTIPWDKVKAAITPKTKAILVNTPHNPTGRVFTKDDILILQEIVLSNNLYLISDEVYEHMVFDGAAQLSAHCLPELAQRLAELPATTLICCAHEYTLANLAFATTVEPDNNAISARIQRDRQRRQQRLPGDDRRHQWRITAQLPGHDVGGRRGG